MRAIRTIAAAVAMFVGAPTAHNESNAYRTAISNVGNETIECAAYFLVLSRVLGAAHASPAGSRRAATASMMMLERALALGGLIDQRSEIVNARFQASFVNIDTATGGEAKALFDRYAFSCLDIANHPIPHLDAWLKKAGVLK